MLTEAPGGVHPRHMLANGGREKFASAMTDSLLRITRPLGSRPIVYRAIDFRTNEFRNLTGSAEFEPPEDNPMIGYTTVWSMAGQFQEPGAETIGGDPHEG